MRRMTGGSEMRVWGEEKNGARTFNTRVRSSRPARCGRAGSRSSSRRNSVWARVSATGSAGGTSRGKVTGF